MHTLEAHTADELYRRALLLVLEKGTISSPRGLVTREVLGPTLQLSDPRVNIVTLAERRLNYSFSVAEWLWILLGRQDVQTISWYNKRIAEFSDDGKMFFGAYGPQVTLQLPYVVRTLKRDQHSRQALISLWHPAPPPTRDVPCTTVLQFLIRDQLLRLHVYMRSNDAWLGLPYDLFNFTQLQIYVADALLGVGVGPYAHTVGSFHLYGPDLEAARRVAGSSTTLLGLSVPLSSPVPPSLNALFEAISTGRAFAQHFDSAVIHEPWAGYLSVLAYWTHRDPERVTLEPYRTLLRERRQEMKTP